MSEDFCDAFHGTDNFIVNATIEIEEDSSFMASQHPDEILELFEPAMSCSREPAFQIRACPDLVCGIPPPSEHLLEETGPCDLKVAFKTRFGLALGSNTSLADAALQLSPLLGIKFNPQHIASEFNENCAMVPYYKGKAYDTFGEHESTFIIGYLGKCLN